MTRDRLDLLLQHCADLGIEVEWSSDLVPGRRGQYRRDGNVITIGLHLIRRQVIATLLHELGHAKFGDTCSTPANERRAWEYGAAMWITPHAYRAAESAVGHSLQALAIELEVTPKLIEAWRRWWFKQGRLLPEYADMVDTSRRDA